MLLLIFIFLLELGSLFMDELRLKLQVLIHLVRVELIASCCVLRSILHLIRRCAILCFHRFDAFLHIDASVAFDLFIGSHRFFIFKCL